VSTIKSSAENLTLNADGSGNDIIFQSNASNVATLDQAGLLTATTFAGSGASLTALNATNLGSGTVPTARLGTGTADSSVHLRGDGTWAAAGGGKVLQVVSHTRTGGFSTGSTSYVSSGLSDTITPSASSSKILVMIMCPFSNTSSSTGTYFNISRAISGGSTTSMSSQTEGLGAAETAGYRGVVHLSWFDSPSTTSAITYSLMIRSSSGGAVEAPAHSTATQSVILMEIGA